MATDQSFAAIDTFNAAFDKTFFPFFGGGVQVLFDDRFFAEVSASRFRQQGQRAYFSGGKSFKLGIPLTATITPLEITGGYRFRLVQAPRVRPYIAAGVGSYAYQETSSFAAAGEDVDTRHVGFVANGGAEFRAPPVGRARGRRAVQPHPGHSRHRRRLAAGRRGRSGRCCRALQADRGPLNPRV